MKLIENIERNAYKFENKIRLLLAHSNLSKR